MNYAEYSSVLISRRLVNMRYDLKFCEEQLIPLIKEIYQQVDKKDLTIHKKGKGNFVTSVDISIENKLKEQLLNILPTSGFITEESEVEYSNQYNWVIDPIDGTTNFIYGYPFSISVALCKQDVQDPILGVVYAPLKDKFFYASKGQGSYVKENNKKRKLTINDVDYEEGISLYGMPYDREKVSMILDVVKKVYPNCSDIKRIGPASLDICRVAEGRAKLYFEYDLNLWDYIAALIVLKEAGGIFKCVNKLYMFANDGKNMPF